MTSDPQRPAWYRIPTPSMLLLVLLLSFLPWIEVGCENKVNTENLFGGKVGPMNVSVSTTSGKTVLATQSGFQIAVGGHTDHYPFGDLSKGGSKGATVGTPAAQGQLDRKDGPDAAPLLLIFFISVAAAVFAGFVMAPRHMRILVIGASTVAALVVLLIQSLVLGFPAVNDVAKHMNQARAAQDVVGLDAGGLFVRYTVWYWLTWVLLFGAFVPLVLEEMWTRWKRPATLPMTD
jgi:hypothetical protein